MGFWGLMSAQNPLLVPPSVAVVLDSKWRSSAPLGAGLYDFNASLDWLSPLFEHKMQQLLHKLDVPPELTRAVKFNGQSGLLGNHVTFTAKNKDVREALASEFAQLAALINEDAANLHIEATVTDGKLTLTPTASDPHQQTALTYAIAAMNKQWLEPAGIEPLLPTAHDMYRAAIQQQQQQQASQTELAAAARAKFTGADKPVIGEKTAALQKESPANGSGRGGKG